jgi:hypothetical protein
MEFYINNPEKLVEMGEQARKDVEVKYEQQHLFSLLADHRDSIIKA